MNMRSFAVACPYCVSHTSGECHVHLHFNVMFLKKCNIIFVCFAGDEVSFKGHVSFCFIKINVPKYY